MPSANIADSMPTAGKQRENAIIAAALIIFCFISWLAIEIPKGILTDTDELLTAERSREMLLTTPWVVHFNFQKSFAKPPLQYWLTLTLPRFENRTLAVRIWPLIYAVLSAITFACLVHVIAPDRPWLVPLTIAILVCCPLFSSEAGRALLDIGLAFFTTLVILFAQLARKHPAWWIGLTQTEMQFYLRQRNAAAKMVKGKTKVRVPEKNIADGKRVAEELGALQSEGTKIVLIKPVHPVGDLRYDSFFLFHGNLRFPVGKLTVDELRGAPPPPPVLGVCVAPDLPVVQEIYGNVQTQFARAQFVLWRVDAK